ncbi:MAG: putative acetyltransferase EpsM [Verrucomicrobia bacterium ADurb.Bin006]|nr:MAG: putative acetyltransferase EpsM [Verrucomicrobia bacterium ADurb.Bin006]
MFMVNTFMVNTLPFLQYGVGGHGKVVWDAACSTGLRVDLVADDNLRIVEFEGLKVIHPSWSGDMGLPPAYEFLVAVGDNAARAELFKCLLRAGGKPRTVCHRFSVVSRTATIGSGTLICAGAVVNPEASVGVNCVLNTASSVDHDCRVGDHAHLCPGVRLGGTVCVGEGAMLGLGAVVLPGVSIGAWSVIGAGAVVLRDLPPRGVAYGNPAHVARILPQPAP